MLAGFIWVTMMILSRKNSVLSQQLLRTNEKVNCSKNLQEFAKAMKHKKQILREAQN